MPAGVQIPAPTLPPQKHSISGVIIIRIMEIVITFLLLCLNQKLMLRVYLDTNVWGRPFDEQSQRRIIEEGEAFFRILEGAHQRKFVIVGSLMLEDEISQIDDKEKREAVEDIVELFVNERVEKFSKSLFLEIKSLGLKDKDAVHLAFAVGNSDYFITCDDKIINKGDGIEKKFGIKVVSPVEFVKEVL